MPPKSMEEVFNKAQESLAMHKKCVSFLKTTRKHMGEELFLEKLISFIHRMLIVATKDAAIDRLMKFIPAYLSSAMAEGDGKESVSCDETTILLLIELLLERSVASEKAVRFRSCQMISSLLNSVGEDADIPSELWDSLEEKMMERLRDRVPIVRMYAVEALARLQDPENQDDQIVSAFVNMLQTDTNK
jgi:condensin complex subunit 3